MKRFAQIVLLLFGLSLVGLFAQPADARPIVDLRVGNAVALSVGHVHGVGFGFAPAFATRAFVTTSYRPAASAFFVAPAPVYSAPAVQFVQPQAALADPQPAVCDPAPVAAAAVPVEQYPQTYRLFAAAPAPLVVQPAVAYTAPVFRSFAVGNYAAPVSSFRVREVVAPAPFVGFRGGFAHTEINRTFVGPFGGVRNVHIVR